MVIENETLRQRPGGRPRPRKNLPTPLDRALVGGTPPPVDAGDPQAQAVPRLRILATLFLVLVVIFGATVVMVHVGILTFPFPRNTVFKLAIVGASIVGAIAMIGVTRRRWSPPSVVVAGMVFQVFGAFCISLAEQQAALPGITGSFSAVWILSFTLLPVTPARTAVVAYLAALTGPLAIVIHLAAGHRPWPPSAFEWLTCVPNFIAATVTVFIGQVIYGLGREVVDARRLGAYQLIEQLGEGGMGEVWRAEHQSLIRPAAVKVLRRELTSHMSRAERESMNIRFQREVQATALLTSPHTVAVFDFGHTHDGTLYYVMELLHGRDVQTLVETYGPQPAERVIYLVRQVCDSLREAHLRSLIHRDIKPANIYVCSIGMKVDFVKVLDFGLVRDLGSNLGLTHEGSVTGTPSYIAPESAAHNQFDARGDLYALGCVMYWLLTGTLVFKAETAAGMIAAHIRDTPEPPSTRTTLPIPAELEAIVMACLSKDPADRPQTAEELSKRLAAVPLTTPWTQDRAVAWWNVNQPDIVSQARTQCHCGDPDPVARVRPAPIVRDAPPAS